MAELVCLGEFITDGERQTARFLEQQLPEDWLVICNKTFVTPLGKSCEAVYHVQWRPRHSTRTPDYGPYTRIRGEAWRSTFS